MSETGDPPRRHGLRGSLLELADASVALLRTRAELFAIEFSEQRERAKIKVGLLVIATIGYTVAWLLLCLLVVAEFWDTHRMLALGGVILFHLAVGLIAGWRASVWGREARTPFAATIAEFERDREWLAERLGEDHHGK